MSNIIIKMGIGAMSLGVELFVLFVLFSIGRLWYFAMKDLKDFDGL